MTPELVQFARDFPGQSFAVLTAFVSAAAASAIRLHRVRSDREYKLSLLELGLSVDDVERLTTGRPFLEQFGALSGGTKAGLIMGAVILGNMVMATFIAVVATGGPMYAGEPRTDFGPPRPVVAPVPVPTTPAPPMPAAAVDPPTDDCEGCRTDPVG
jgi:hypothetical protein